MPHLPRGTLRTDPGLRPRLRGVLHQYAFFVSVLAGVVVVTLATDVRERVGATVYALSLSGLLGASALYHRGPWTPRVRAWMQRLDHSAIYLLIAGTYTPLALTVLDNRFGHALLVVVWAGALAGITIKLAWWSAPRWLSFGAYLVLGWIMVFAMPSLWTHLGHGWTLLLAAGGLLYSVGAVILGLRRPDPVPHVFGYHEVFHLLVVLAAAAQYAAVVAAF